MKKLLFKSLPLIISIAMFGCNHSERTQVQSQPDKKSIVDNEHHKQKFIIRNHVNDRLPPEVENVEAMPDNGGPQLIPKADPHKPIVITRMPYSKNGKNQSN